MSGGANGVVPDEAPDVGRGLFRTRGFLVPYLAETQSIAGDQVGRVALSILVFDRTGSVAWTALTYALTYVPAILGGMVLGGAGDRFPRRWVMVGADVLRALLFLGVAIPGVPLPVVVALIAVAFFLGPGFTAAMVSRLSAVLAPSRFRAASGIRMITSQAAQVGGFALGGVVVGIVHPRIALAINAGTFAVSALVLGMMLGREPGYAPSSVPQPTTSDPVAAARPSPRPQTPVQPGGGPPAPRLLGDPWLRQLILMSGLAAFFVVPEGLAVPLSAQLGEPSAVAGLLLAAGPLGSAVGAALLVKVVPHRNGMKVARIMAVACGAPLVVTALLPSWPLIFVCWASSGALWAYQVDVATALVHAVDERARSRAIARASAVLLGAQGAGLAVFGAVGQWAGAQWGVAIAGLLGVVSAGTIVAHASRSAVGPPDASRHATGGMSGERDGHGDRSGKRSSAARHRAAPRLSTRR